MKIGSTIRLCCMRCGITVNRCNQCSKKLKDGFKATCRKGYYGYNYFHFCKYECFKIFKPRLALRDPLKKVRK